MVRFPYEPSCSKKRQSYVCVLYPDSCMNSVCCPDQSMPEGPIVMLDAFAECLAISVVRTGEAVFRVTRSGAM